MAMLRAMRLSRATIAALSGAGVFWGSFASMVPALKQAAGATDAVWGLCLMTSSIGGVTAMYLAPLLAPVLGRALLPAAGVLLSAAAVLPTTASSAPGFAIAMLVLGFAMALYDMSGNLRIAVLESRHSIHLQNLNHAMFAFSFAASAFLTTLARKAGWMPADVLPWLVLALLLLAALTHEGSGWTPAPVQEIRSDAGMPWATILLVAAILFAAFVSENANESWSALHIERTFNAPRGDGGFGPAMLGLTMGAGRMTGQFLTARLGEVRLILWGAVLGTAGLVLLALAPAQGLAVSGVGLFGLGVAVMVPTANAVLGRLVPGGLQSFAIARAWMIGFTGFFIGPTLIGAIAQAADLRAAFMCVAAVMATIIPTVLLLRKKGA